MKAMTYTRYGSPDVLQLTDVEKPTPKANEVLVQIHAASINFADNALLRGDPFLLRLDSGLQKPKNIRLGADVAGIVEAIGSNVTRFKPGDEVYGDLSGGETGSYAEYICAPENVLALKPINLTFEEAAAVPLAGITALQGVRDTAQIQAGQKVLVHGASGGVGTFALQIAKALGAEVTAVCSTRNVEMVHSLGADHIIDYKQEDFLQSGQLYDVIIAVNGNRSIFEYRRALEPNGCYIMLGGTMSQIFQAMLLGPLVSVFGNKKLSGMGTAKANKDDLADMTDLIEAGKVVPVIDRCYALEELAEAFRYFKDVHAQGKIVISMKH